MVTFLSLCICKEEIRPALEGIRLELRDLCGQPTSWHAEGVGTLWNSRPWLRAALTRTAPPSKGMGQSLRCRVTVPPRRKECQGPGWKPLSAVVAKGRGP